MEEEVTSGGVVTVPRALTALGVLVTVLELTGADDTDESVGFTGTSTSILVMNKDSR